MTTTPRLIIQSADGPPIIGSDRFKGLPLSEVVCERIPGRMEPPKIMIDFTEPEGMRQANLLRDVFHNLGTIRSTDGKIAAYFIITEYEFDDSAGIATFKLKSTGKPAGKPRKTDMRIS